MTHPSPSLDLTAHLPCLQPNNFPGVFCTISYEWPYIYLQHTRTSLSVKCVGAGVDDSSSPVIARFGQAPAGKPLHDSMPGFSPFFLHTIEGVQGENADGGFLAMETDTYWSKW